VRSPYYSSKKTRGKENKQNSWGVRTQTRRTKCEKSGTFFCIGGKEGTGNEPQNQVTQIARNWVGGRTNWRPRAYRSQFNELGQKKSQRNCVQLSNSLLFVTINGVGGEESQLRKKPKVLRTKRDLLVIRPTIGGTKKRGDHGPGGVQEKKWGGRAKGMLGPGPGIEAVSFWGKKLTWSQHTGRKRTRRKKNPQSIHNTRVGHYN